VNRRFHETFQIPYQSGILFGLSLPASSSPAGPLRRRTRRSLQFLHASSNRIPRKAGGPGDRSDSSMTQGPGLCCGDQSAQVLIQMRFQDIETLLDHWGTPVERNAVMIGLCNRFFVPKSRNLPKTP